MLRNNPESGQGLGVGLLIGAGVVAAIAVAIANSGSSGGGSGSGTGNDGKNSSRPPVPVPGTVPPSDALGVPVFSKEESANIWKMLRDSTLVNATDVGDAGRAAQLVYQKDGRTDEKLRVGFRNRYRTFIAPLVNGEWPDNSTLMSLKEETPQSLVLTLVKPLGLIELLASTDPLKGQIA